MARKERKPYQIGDYRGWLVPAWSSRAASIAINVVFLMQINYYCTNALGLEAGLTGLVLMFSKIFDGFTDLFAGLFVDRTKTRWGKARPYEFCILGVWICTVLLFSTPHFGTVGKYIWLFVFYTLINSVFATFLGATDAVYLGRAVKDGRDQAKLMTINGVIVMVFCTLISIILPQLIATYGQQEGGWTMISLILGVPLSILGLGRFFFVKEMDMGDQGESSSTRVTVKTILSILKTNKYIFIISASTLLYNLINGFITSVTTYYFQYIYGDIGAASLVGMVGMITPFIFLVLPLLLRKFSLAQITMAGFVMSIAGNLIKFIGGPNMVTLMGGSLLANLGGMPISLLISIFLIECMDYGEWKNGVRLEGAYGSVNGFANKVGSGFSSVIAGFIMQAAGFNGSLAVQSSSANFSIVALFSLIPAALFVVSILVFRKYDLYKQMPQIHKDLEERRAAAVAQN